MKMTKLSTLRTGHFYPAGNTPWYSFIIEAEVVPKAIVLFTWSQPADFRLVAQRHRVSRSKKGEMLINPYPTAFPYGNGMVLHFYQQQESSKTKTVHKVINKRLKTYV